mmetsp:Transcript_35182/g.54987  ORF Transcript_35182/g.54987 Transcript_35182/m.54987 type:complete len:201 (-) Transcript_35182:280-882(-)
MADIKKIENLSECVNLQELNLAGNDIEVIEGLDKLVNLRKLVLTTNKISALSGLQNCSSLEHLLVQENSISNIAELAAVTSLPNLKSIYFRNIDGTQRNPVCDHPSYRSSIMRQLPSLTILDGERLKHSNSFYGETPTAPGPAPKVVIPESKPWLGEFSWDEQDLDMDGLLKGSQSRFDSVHSECKKLNAAAVSLLSHYQ